MFSVFVPYFYLLIAPPSIHLWDICEQRMDIGRRPRRTEKYAAQSSDSCMVAVQRYNPRLIQITLALMYNISA